MVSTLFRSIAALMLVVHGLLIMPLPAHAIPSETMHLAALPLISNFMKGQRPSTLGVKDGKLSPCPSSPNCVVSQGQEDAEHAIAPIPYQGDPVAARDRLVEVIQAMPGSEIIQQTDDYIYAEFTSALMGGRELNKRGIRHRHLMNQVMHDAMSLLRPPESP
jgi:uncharacterized protein (DUF1499 family)